LVQGGWLEAGSAAVVAPAGAIGSGCGWQAAHAKNTAKIEIKRMVLSARNIWDESCGDDRLARGTGCLLDGRIKRQMKFAKKSVPAKLRR
jgi:hypothetical protein